jgi:hypothetical protein
MQASRAAKGMHSQKGTLAAWPAASAPVAPAGMHRERSVKRKIQTFFTIKTSYGC